MRAVRVAKYVGTLLIVAEACYAAGLLPLKHGIFVDQSVGCANASNASVLSFWGDELNSGKVVGTIIKVSRKGAVHRVAIDVNSEGRDTGRETWTLFISGPKKMKVTSQYGTSTYIWCFDRMPF